MIGKKALPSPTALNESRLSQYHFVGTVAGCQLYSSWDQKAHQRGDVHCA
jgi:hypothetical protein